MTRRIPGSQVRLIRRGEAITADWLNETAANAERGARAYEEIDTEEPEGEDYSDQTVRDPKWLQIKTLNASDLVCTLPGLTAEPTAEQFLVALPITFTEASRGGVSYVYSTINTRTADGTESQELTPVYIVGDLIFAMDDGAGYRDINVDGRQWAKV